MKNLPLGIQTFSKIIEGNCYYVDKTEYVAKLANHGTYFFLSRPRRFGKSLFLDTLKEAYEGNEALFKGLFLEKNWDWSQKYPVIKISFGGGVTQSKVDLLEKINWLLQNNLKKLGIVSESKNPSNTFADLIKNTHEKYQQKVVILIDEYDKPILDVIDKEEVALQAREEL
ncbi:MAG: AAA family ATPase, partial [Spirochaetota bacterium]